MNGANAERPAGWKEARRLRAWELAGMGVAKGAVSQWAAKPGKAASKPWAAASAQGDRQN